MRPAEADEERRREGRRDATGATKDDINFFFGWELKKMSEEMQLHYSGLDRVQRLKLSKVTMMV